MAKWKKTQFTGIEFYQHETRRHGVKKDRYFRGRFTFRGRTYSSGFGWSSEGWTPSKAFAKLQSYRHNAKAGQGPTTFKAEQELHEVERAKLEEQRRLQAKEDITFSDFFENTYISIAMRNVKEKTLKTQAGHYRYWLKPVLGNLTFKQIRPFHIEKIKKNMLTAGKSPRTLQNCLATFRQTWNTARLQDLTNKNTPTRKVKIPKFDNKRKRYLSRDEAEKLLAELKRRSTQLYNLSLLALHTGMRAKELFDLTWGNVDLENGLITIQDSKSVEPRYVYLTEDTKAMLAGLQNNQAKNELVFKDRHGKKMREISNAFGAAVKDLGLNDGIADRRQRVCFHSLRHTYASWLIDSGISIYTVKKLLGHSTIQLTERYSHLQKDGLLQAVREFDKKMNSHKVTSIYQKVR